MLDYEPEEDGLMDGLFLTCCFIVIYQECRWSTKEIVKNVWHHQDLAAPTSLFIYNRDSIYILHFVFYAYFAPLVEILNKSQDL